MKINWGTGLVIGMIAFIAFILFFVYRMNTDRSLDHDLVTESYYQKEMELQGEIDARQHAAALSEPITGTKTSVGYRLRFPETFRNSTLEGEVVGYRPSDKSLDFKMPIVLEGTELTIPDAALLPGRWNFMITWTVEGTTYRVDKQITY